MSLPHVSMIRRRRIEGRFPTNCHHPFTVYFYFQPKYRLEVLSKCNFLRTRVTAEIIAGKLLYVGEP